MRQNRNRVLEQRCLLITAILVSVFCARATAGEYTPATLPNVHLYDKTRYVVNPDGILSPSAAARIDSMLYALETSTGAETVVAAVESIGEQECFDFCHTLLNSWGVGKKGKDNGLVVLLVTDQRCIQFCTGYGLEGVLPDAICKRIQMQLMVPYLKQGEWDAAMLNGMEAVCRRIGPEHTNDAVVPDSSYNPLWLLLLLFVIIGIAAIKARQITNAHKMCPRCGKPELRPTDSRMLVEKDGKMVNRVVYKCAKCGYTVARDDDRRDDDTPHGGHRRSSGSLLDAILLGSLLGGMGRGGSFGGGGFGGGSFGGGAGGGGGAGSRF